MFSLSGPWALFEHWSLGSDAGVCQKSHVTNGSQSVVRGALEVPKILSGGLQDQNTFTVSYHVICIFPCVGICFGDPKSMISTIAAFLA